ncbi:MAG: hypothetical protein IJR14_10435, partial [Synergistaceae bacterium]|nr:hypothetical protein [Synergistaceae bacterium]
MARISDVVPPLYRGSNLDGFTAALDPETEALRRKIRALPSLIDIDGCPDDKLPYLAATIGCPLIGEDPKYWRKQIAAWPWLLKTKGTQRSLELVLESIGADRWEIRTWFRDASGGYVTDPPGGDPFLSPTDGLWRNSRTHYFSVEIWMGSQVLQDEDAFYVDEIKERLGLWMERGKPFHAELLHLTIVPPEIDWGDHLCLWDVCTWEHGEPRPYPWGGLGEDGSYAFDVGADLASELSRVVWRDGAMETLREDRWDIVAWGVPIRRGERE